MSIFNGIEERYAALVHVDDTDENLRAINEVYLKGQIVFATDANGRVGVKKGTWDWKSVPKEAGTKYADLDWFIDPAQSGSNQLNIFKVTTANLATVNPKLEVIDGDTVITDDRLKGKADYFVGTNQAGSGEFYDEQLIYDGVNGKVTIKGFVLDDNAKIRIIIPQGLGADIDYSTLVAKVNAIEAKQNWLLAPFIANGSMVFWNKPYSQIPAGWEEVEEMRGLFPKGVDPDNIDEEIWTTTSGAETLLLGVQHIPEMDPANGEYDRLLKYDGTGTVANSDNQPGPSYSQPNLESSARIKKVGTPVADQVPIDLENPNRRVMYIRPIEGYNPPI